MKLVEGLVAKPPSIDFVHSSWPWPLRKAAHDPFLYVCGLRDGTIVRFEQVDAVRSSREWATLLAAVVLAGPIVGGGYDAGDGQRRAQHFDYLRGFVVRVSDIVWVIDAPYGS